MERNHPSSDPVSARRRSRALLGLLASAALASAACSGNHRPATAPTNGAGPVIATGMASWYGPKFNGRRTASGERYDMHALTAAHPTLPFGTLVQVTNRQNGRQVVVRINDRGPFGRRRIIDLSYAAARQLDILGDGTAEVELALASRYDMPPPQPAPYLIASAEPPPPATAGSPAPQPPAAPATGSRWRPAPAAPGAEAAELAAAPRSPSTGRAAATASAAEEALQTEDAPEAATARADTAASPSGDLASAAPLAGAGLHFTVQVGAFGQLERAAALQQSLAARYPAVAVRSDGIWNRVQIGDFGARDQAEALRGDLSAQGFDAIVVAAR